MSSRLRFRFNWRVTLFTAVFLVVFTNLGLWQLGRAADKKDLKLLAASTEQAAPVRSLRADLADGARVVLTGRYLPDLMMLLDNRTLEGRVGFEVLVPFAVEDSGDLVIVNRGFVPMGRTRQDAVQPPVLIAGADVQGAIHKPADNRFIANDPVQCDADPCIVAEANPALMTGHLGRQAYPHVVRLDESDPNALPRYWPISVMSAEQHRGYAAQWFTMAVALMALYLFFSFRREDDGPNER